MFGKEYRDLADMLLNNQRAKNFYKDLPQDVQQIITEKMEVEMEIQTVVAASANEQTIMTVLPIILIALIKMMSPEFAANFVTPVGLIATTIAIVMFVVAYFVGKKILAIKI